jgi:hypothetical protein
VDTSPRKHVVVPPFCKKPPAASGTFEALESNSSDGVERHPTKRRYKRWRCGFENPYGQKSEYTNDWHVGQERKQQKIPTLSILAILPCNRPCRFSLTYRGSFAAELVNCRKQAFTQLCAVCSPFCGSTSVMIP